MPGVTLRISGANEALPGLQGSYCQSGGCSGSCGDYGPLVPTLVQVRVTPPLTLEVQTGSGVTEIRGEIREGDSLSGSPIEAFVLAGQSAKYVSQVMAPGHRYYIFLDVHWSLPLNTGGRAHFFRVELLPP